MLHLLQPQTAKPCLTKCFDILIRRKISCFAAHSRMLWRCSVYYDILSVYRCSDTESSTTIFPDNTVNESCLIRRVKHEPRPSCRYACERMFSVYAELSQSPRGKWIRSSQTPLWKWLTSGPRWRILALVSLQMSAPFIFCCQRDDLCGHPCSWERQRGLKEPVFWSTAQSGDALKTEALGGAGAKWVLKEPYVVLEKWSKVRILISTIWMRWHTNSEISIFHNWINKPFSR